MDLSLRSLYQPTVLLAIALMAVIVMMVLPMPSWVLDMGLACSFALATLIFTITLFIQRPLDFSAFPTVLLASLMLRLSLNVSSTKLIIGQGHTGTHAAGDVIEGFAMFIMGGSVFLGLVVFGVLLIVNFIVITKGAGRMAEVGARFALDGMPGKQLAIDSDMAAGAISHAEARERRRIEQEETTFFGSLDGASKFVKGDAVAGLLITLLNLMMGLAMGVLVHGMPIRDAFETYAILTVGDGLVTQIPAVIISIASAMLLSKGGLVGSTDRALIRQLGGYPTALATVAVLMAVFAFIPGLPFVPFLIGAGSLAGAAWVARQTKTRDAAAATAAPEAKAPAKRSLGDLLDVDEIHMEFAPNLVPVVMDEATGLDARILNMRNHIATEFGLILPEIRLTDNPSLALGQYAIRIQGVEVARSTIETDKVLVLLPEEGAPAPEGRTVAEPVYGAPARWIAPALQEDAALMGLAVVTPTEVVATHLLEIVKANFGRLFSRRSLRKLLDEFTSLSDARRAEANRRMIEEFIPEKVPVDTLQAVLRLLLEERVSIRNLPLILEAIAEAHGRQASPEVLCEQVRHRLGFQIIAEIQEADGALPLIQLNPSWEEMFQAYQLPEGSGIVDVALPPAEFNRLANAVAEQDRPRRGAGALPGGGDLDQAPAVPPHGAEGQGHPQPGLLLRGDRHGRQARRPGARLMIGGLAALLDMTQAGLAAFLLVFCRISGVMTLLPAFGEQTIPARVRLAAAVAFSLVVWSMLAPELARADAARPLLAMIVIEITIGLMLGLAIRLMVIALQLAGSIAAQSTALSQIFGAGVTPDPMPAIGNLLTMAGLTLAVASGLHVKAAIAMARSYEILPMGLPVPAADVAAWGTARVAQAFALGFSLAAPFVIGAFAYNLALGAINRAMPQLMVAFIGAPAITAGGLLLLMLAAPVILHFWGARLDLTLADPLALPR